MYRHTERDKHSIILLAERDIAYISFQRDRHTDRDKHSINLLAEIDIPFIFLQLRRQKCGSTVAKLNPRRRNGWTCSTRRLTRSGSLCYTHACTYMGAHIHTLHIICSFLQPLYQSIIQSIHLSISPSINFHCRQPGRYASPQMHAGGDASRRR